MRMLTKSEILDAVRYNNNKNGVIWRLSDLPGVLRDGVNSEFVAWVCAYQGANSLSIDGKLGPATFKAIGIRRKTQDVVAPKPVAPAIKNGPSNCIVVNGERVRLPNEMIEAGYVATNYLDDGEPRFSHRKRKSALRHFVLHETCGSTASGCKNTLKSKGYGVQLIMDPWGRISCHGDLVMDQMVHANQLNKSSFGCEMVNPYSPLYVRKSDEGLWSKRLPKQWWTWVPSMKSERVKRTLKRKGWDRVPREYVCLTDDQVESMKMFAPWVVGQISLFPYNFPTNGLRRDVKLPGPGVVAHQDFASHADGRYMLEILIKEFEK